MLSTDEAMQDRRRGRERGRGRRPRRQTQPDVVILDVEMPVMGAAEAMDGLLSPLPHAEDPDRHHVRQPAPGARASRARRERLPGQERLPRRAAGRGARRGQVALGSERGARRPGRPPRDLEKVEGRRRGRALRQGAGDPAPRRPRSLQPPIATSLTLSEATVKRHLANVYAKMRVGSRSEAARKALSEGWIHARDLTREGNDSPSQPPGR